jgi:putative transposase
MSIPREVLPQRTYMITRRCTQRQFLLTPDRETNNAFIYCLATAALRYGIQVLFTVAMSNHHHTGIYDAAGNYPAFLEHFHKLLAKCQNARRGRRENFWSSEQTNVVLLESANDVLARMTYALANPVKDHLVAKATDWPGVSSLSSMLTGRALVATRPRHFFREDGDMPDGVTLTFARPSCFEHLTPQQYASLICENVARAEKVAEEERIRTGAQVLGRAAVLRQDWRASPRTDHGRAEESPLSSGRSKWARIEAYMRSRPFRDAYVAARETLMNGVRDVVFPAGTYWLRRFAQVTCASAGTSAALLAS